MYFEKKSKTNTICKVHTYSAKLLALYRNYALSVILTLIKQTTSTVVFSSSTRLTDAGSCEDQMSAKDILDYECVLSKFDENSPKKEVNVRLVVLMCEGQNATYCKIASIGRRSRKQEQGAPA